MSLGGFRMNYENMSDFEINKAVAEKCGLKVPESQYPELQDDVLIINDKMEIEFSSSVNYCNSWEDMGPIIASEKIAISYHNSVDAWTAGSCTKSKFSLVQQKIAYKNPLRAAAIVYLMMEDAE
jgi:hypothetical protein